MMAALSHKFSPGGRYAASDNVLPGLAGWCGAGCVTVKVSLFEEPGPLKEKTISGYGRDKILLMDVAGFIRKGRNASWRWGRG